MSTTPFEKSQDLLSVHRYHDILLRWYDSLLNVEALLVVMSEEQLKIARAMTEYSGTDIELQKVAKMLIDRELIQDDVQSRN